MIYISWLIFAAGLAVFLWFKRLDWWKSSLQVIHLPPVELNPVTRGKDGYFNQTRAYLVSGVMVAIATACAVGISLANWEGAKYAPMLVGIIFAAWCGIVWIVIKKDIDVLNRHIDEQKVILSKLKSDPEGPLNHKLVGLKNCRGNLRWVFSTFYDFGIDSGLALGTNTYTDIDQRDKLAIITPRLVKLVQMPESEWFKAGRAVKI